MLLSPVAPVVWNDLVSSAPLSTENRPPNHGSRCRHGIKSFVVVSWDDRLLDSCKINIHRRHRPLQVE
jgi:hypothetical protein